MIPGPGRANGYNPFLLIKLKPRTPNSSMFDLIRHFQDLEAAVTTPATMTAACVTGSVSTAEAEANAIVSGFADIDFEGTNDHTYIGSTLEGRTGYHDHATIAKAIINNAIANNQDVTGNSVKTLGKCPASTSS
jgi:hypothetical protein